MATDGWREITSQTERWKKEELRGNPNILSERINWEGKRKRKTKQVLSERRRFHVAGAYADDTGEFLAWGGRTWIFPALPVPWEAGARQEVRFWGHVTSLFFYSQEIYLFN